MKMLPQKSHMSESDSSICQLEDPSRNDAAVPSFGSSISKASNTFMNSMSFFRKSTSMKNDNMLLKEKIRENIE